MSGRSTRVTGAVATILALVAAVAVAGGLLASRGRPARHGPPPATAPTGSLGSARQLRGTNLTLVPARGAYLGAYVQPASYTQRGLVNAVRSFEQRVGQPLGLVHTYDKWGRPFPTLAERYFADSGKVLLLTWGGTPDTRAIIAGRDDALIRARAVAIRQLGRPILVEFRHEMDRPNLQWTIHGPADYIAAWDHIRAIFTAAGATNVSWVWCPTGYGFQLGRAQAFYPGRAQVDWVCADVYANSPAQSLSAAAAPFLTWARHTGKPVIIGEFAANGLAAGWSSWLAQAGRLAESDRQIRALAYFSGDGTDSNGRPFRYRLTSRPTALAAFGRLLSEPFFRPAVRGQP